MVARFDSLQIKDYKQREEVVMKRLEMSKELAEMETNKLKEKFGDQEVEMKKYREEAKKLRKELEEMKERERKAAKKIEVARDELTRAKATHEHAVGIYEKEIRRARKEAFKSSSSLVKIQEELKATRNSSNILKQGMDLEKAKSQRYEQEAFSSQYRLVGMQEEFIKVQERLKLVEEERDSLKTALKEEEVARIAAEGLIALPDADEDDDDLLASPMKSPRKPVLSSDCDDKENVIPGKAKLELRSLHEDLATERRRARRAEEQIEFMKMECQFQCCSCRVAESQGQKYVHDGSFEKEIEEMRSHMPANPMRSLDIRDFMQDDSAVEQPPPRVAKRTSLRAQKRNSRRQSEFLIDFASPVKVQAKELPAMVAEEVDGSEMLSELMEQDVMAEDEGLLDAEPSVIINAPIAPADKDERPDEMSMATPPRTPSHENIQLDTETPAFKTITHTMTIPMTFTPAPKDHSIHNFPASAAPKLSRPSSTSDLQTPKAKIPGTPVAVAHAPIISDALPSPFVGGAFLADGTLDRAAALEQIRLRRGRARSVVLGHATPKKPVTDGRRDISAPALKSASKS